MKFRGRGKRIPPLPRARALECAALDEPPLYPHDPPAKPLAADLVIVPMRK